MVVGAFQSVASRYCRMLRILGGVFFQTVKDKLDMLAVNLQKRDFTTSAG
jgi:hypothetical protein